MLRDGENVFLDDMTVEELEEALRVPVSVVDTSGAALVAARDTGENRNNSKRRQIYEQADSSYCGTPQRG